MNLIDTLKARIEKGLEDTKSPCKVYKTEATAERATRKMAIAAADHFDANFEAHHVTFEVEGFGWVGCVNLTELLGRPETIGGYLGVCTGFYTW